MWQILIGGALALWAVHELSESPTEEKAEHNKSGKSESKSSSIDEIKGYIKMDGAEKVLELMQEKEYRNVKSFHDIGSRFVHAMKELKSEISKLNPTDKKIVRNSINKQGFDVAFTDGNDFEEIKSKSFHNARKNYVSMSEKVIEYSEK